MTETAIIDGSEGHNLTAFREHLPDADSELFHHKEDRVFMKFSELPPELRLHIWRDTFPEDTRKFKIHPRSKGGRPGPLVASRNLITLQINQESRAEALRHYKVLLEHESGFKHYYNPIIDRVLVYHWFPFWHEVAKSQFMGWKWHGRRTARFVEIAELWHMHWDCRRTRMSKLEGLGQAFQRLETLEVYSDKYFLRGHLEDVESLKECYESLDRQFVKGKEESREDGYRIPKISIVGYPRK